MVTQSVTRSNGDSVTLQYVNPTPGECHMVTPCQVLNLHLAKVLDYNSMQVYMLRFATLERLNRRTSWTCIFFRESLTWRDAERAVIPRKSP